MLASTVRRSSFVFFAVSVAVALAGCGTAPGPASAKPGASAGGAPAAPAAVAPATAPTGPAVVTLSKNYLRTASRVLVRKVTVPSLANLEFAVYDTNIAMTDPRTYTHAPVARRLPLAELDFDGTLVKGTIVDRIEGTPLTAAEKDAPYAWFPMTEHLMNDWDFTKGAAISDAGAKVGGTNWGDTEIPIPFQEITRVYIHGAGSAAELWVRVEFKPWAQVTEGVDDEDADGYPEIYGRFASVAVTPEVFAELTGPYRTRPLTSADVLPEPTTGKGGWAFELCSYLYPKYNTELLDAVQLAGFPDVKAQPLIGDGLACLGGARPTIVIAARPFEATDESEEWHVWNVFVIEGFAE